LGYHHVISTYTRLCFDKKSLAAHRFMLFGLPILVLAATISIVMGVGAWLVFSIYFYWQWFHYTRQAYGVARAYRRAGGEMPEPEWLSNAVIYLTAIWGILSRSQQGHQNFLGMDIHMLPVPAIVATCAGVLAVVAVFAWFVVRVWALQQGRGSLAHTLFVLTHVSIFVVGYIVIDDITSGWLVANIWHNAQYILFVWLFNNKRYQGRIDDGARFLSQISQRKHLAVYLMVCLGISTLLYKVIEASLPMIGLPAVAAAAIVYQTINFHHYIVDALIWRSPKSKGTSPHAT